MYDYNCPDCNEAKLQSYKNARKINDVIYQVNSLIQVNNETVDFIEEKAEEKIEEIAEEKIEEIAEIKVNEVLGDLRTEIDDVKQQQDELFQSVSNGKKMIASAITDKGIKTSDNDTFENMANNILSISISGGESGGGIGNYTETPVYEDGYRVIFYDDFKTLNRNYWHEGYLSCWAPKEQQVYGRPRYELNNGLKLMIKNANDAPWCPDYDGVLIASGLMTGTRDGLHDFKGDGTTLKVRTHQQKYFGQITKCGKFEMVAKTPQTGGNMAAWWLIGIQDTETQNCEIDIFENIGNVRGQVMSSLHNWNDSTVTPTRGFKYQTDVDLSEDYHKYTLIWDEENLKFYFDDILYLTCSSNITYPLMQIITCYERQSSWVGNDYDPLAPYPKTLDIKYIKVSKKIPDGYNEVENLSIVSQDEINFETSNPIIINGELKGLQSYCTLRFNDGTDEQFFVRWETLTEDDLENKEEITINGYIYNCSQNLLNGMKAIANIKFITPLTGIELTLNTVDYIVGETANISVKYIPSNTPQKGVNYSSSDTSIATVDTNGVVSFLKEGSVTLYATSTVDSSIVGSITIYVSATNVITHYSIFSKNINPNSWFSNTTLTEGFSFGYNTNFFTDENYVANNLSNNYNLPLSENSNYIKNTDEECYMSLWGSIYYRLNKSRYEDIGIETYLANNPLEFKIDITKDETIVTKETIKLVNTSYFLNGSSDGTYFKLISPCLNTFSEFSNLFTSTNNNNTILWVKNNSVPTTKPTTPATYIEIGVNGYFNVYIPVSLLETVDIKGANKYLQTNPIMVCYISRV